MAGIVYTPIWEGEGTKKSFLVGTAPITLGQVVALDTNADNTVVTGTAALKNVAIGVATETRRTSASLGSSTAQTAAVGEYVTVTMMGIVNVVASGAITRGDLVEAANDGKVSTHTPGAGGYAAVLGRALTTAGDGENVKILLGRIN